MLLKWQKAIGKGIPLAILLLWFNQSVVANAQTRFVAEERVSEKAIYIGAQHEIRTKRYTVTGNKEGLVKFGDFQRNVYNHFQMDTGKWARELFVLNDGKTVGASQEDHTVFWNAATGKEIGRVSEHVYGFSHDQKHFIAQNGHNKISIYQYAGFKRIAQFQPPCYGGICAFLFSQDDRYCAVSFESASPASEATYPMVFNMKNMSAIQLYSLSPVGEVPNFAALNANMGTFADDSSAYFGSNPVYIGNDWTDGPWRFDLKTFKVETVKAAAPVPQK